MFKREIVPPINEEANDLIERPPSWIVRSGTMVISGFFMIMLLISWIIKYPETIHATITITTNPPPVILVARNSGNLKILKSEAEYVHEGDLIAYLQSAADVTSVLQLEKSVQNSSLPVVPRGNNLLGDIENYYSHYVMASNVLNHFLQKNMYDIQIAELKKHEESYVELNAILKEQIQLAEKEQILANEKFQTDSTLFSQKVLSSVDFNQAKQVKLQQKKSLISAKTVWANNGLQRKSISKQITDLSLLKVDYLKSYTVDFNNSRNELLSALKHWKERNLFIAPMEGTLAHLGILEDNKFIKSDDALFVIEPLKKQITGIAEVVPRGAGKIRKGQSVNIALENYPHEQFGYIRGRVVSISNLPAANKYFIRIDLTEGLKTSQNITLPFQQQLVGTTEIITEDLRLFERFFQEIKRLTSETK